MRKNLSRSSTLTSLLQLRQAGESLPDFTGHHSSSTESFTLLKNSCVKCNLGCACYKLIAAQFPCCEDQTDGTCRSALFVVGRVLLGSVWALAFKNSNRAYQHFQYLLWRLSCVGRVGGWKISFPFPSPLQRPHRTTGLVLLPRKGKVLRYRALVNHHPCRLIPGHRIGSTRAPVFASTLIYLLTPLFG